MKNKVYFYTKVQNHQDKGCGKGGNNGRELSAKLRADGKAQTDLIRGRSCSPSAGSWGLGRRGQLTFILKGTGQARPSHPPQEARNYHGKYGGTEVVIRDHWLNGAVDEAWAMHGSASGMVKASSPPCAQKASSQLSWKILVSPPIT